MPGATPGGRGRRSRLGAEERYLRVRGNGSLGFGEITITQSRCSITGTGVTVPSGAIGGVLLTGLVAVGFAFYQIRRSRTRRSSRDLIPALGIFDQTD